MLVSDKDDFQDMAFWPVRRFPPQRCLPRFFSVRTLRQMVSRSARLPQKSVGEVSGPLLALRNISASDFRPAKHPNHLWHVDLTVLPIGGGFWTSWLPFSLPQEWPYCWWLVIVEDHFSHRALATEKFDHQPSAEEATAVLDRAARHAKTYPKHLVCDQGSQFTTHHFESWAETNNVKVRYGAVGQHGSIAVIERLIRTIKYEWFRLGCVSKDAKQTQARLERCRVWHNQFRPHEALDGTTPDEVYFAKAKAKANEKPRYEPRHRWPRDFPCARPQAPPKRKARGKLTLEVQFFHNNRALPIVRRRRAA